MYSEKLINEVKRLYSDRPDIINLAEKGDKWLGRSLAENPMDKFVHVDVLLELLKEESANELAILVNSKKEKMNLYDLWTKEYNERK